MKTNHRIVIEISGGNVQEIYTNIPEKIQIDILDRDNQTEESETGILKEFKDMEDFIKSPETLIHH